MTQLRGRVSWFGGPDDMGVAPDEGLAFIYDVSDAPQLFLDEQPPGTSGLARRLCPETFYIATRWDYDVYPKSMLPNMKVLVRAIKTGKAEVCRPADWGPHSDTNRCADISPGLMSALGIETDDEVIVEFPYTGKLEMSDIPVCIDISHHQGYPDFDEVAQAGVKGIIHKCSEGTSFIDSARAENCSNAKKAGLAISTYHWLSPGSDASAQMEFYLSLLDPAKGERVVIDYEQDGCTLAMLKDAVQALIDYNCDLQITVYSGHLLKEQLNGSCDDFLAEKTDLWLAQYTSSDPSWSEGTYPNWTLWQYSETGSVPGIDDSYVDLNNFNGDEEAFLKWISPAGGIAPPIPPEPQPDVELVNVAITAPDNIEVRVSVNGTMARRHRLRRPAKRGPDLLWLR